MKKLTALLFCLGLCLTVAFFFTQLGQSEADFLAHGDDGIVDNTNCIASGCHVSAFGAEGSLHSVSAHSSCAACHEGGVTTAGTVFASACIVCHPLEGTKGLCPLANAHGSSCLTCHSDCAQVTTTTTSVPGAAVAIDPATVTLQPGDTQIFEAVTTGGDNPPVYTWDVEGGTVSTGNTGNTTNTIEYTAGNTPGNYTITVTDTANGNIQATAAVTIEAEVTCTVTVLDEEILKSHWVARPALIRIQTTGFEVSQATDVLYVSDADGGALKSIIPLVKLVIPDTGIINQLAIISPAFFTGNFDAETETITVAVEGCTQTDTFKLKLLSLGPIPLNK